MTTGQLAHPHADQLSDFALGKLDSAEIDAVENHLAECPSCAQTLQQIQDDTFTGLVRSSVADAGQANSADTIAPPVSNEAAPVPAADSATAWLPTVSGPNQPVLLAELADQSDWEEFWSLKERAPRQEQVKFKNYDAALRKGGTTPDDFRLLPDAARKDIGADMDLLGPGAAYERWRKTPEYQQWQKQI